MDRYGINKYSFVKTIVVHFPPNFRALADTDADGKMNLIEFSIACKLISLKLRNVEVPKQLPPTLIASLQHTGAPIRTPTGSLSPVEGYKTLITSISSQSVPMQSYNMIPQQQAPQSYQIPSSEINVPSEVPKVLPLVSSQPPLLLESFDSTPLLWYRVFLNQ